MTHSILIVVTGQGKVRIFFREKRAAGPTKDGVRPRQEDNKIFQRNLVHFRKYKRGNYIYPIDKLKQFPLLMHYIA